MWPAVVLGLLVAVFVQAGSDSAESAASRAAAQIQAHDFRSAVETLRSALAHSAGTPDLWNLLGISESELGHAAQARTAFEQGLKLDSRALGLNQNLGFLYYRQANYAAAMPYLEKAVTLGSSDPGVAFSLATCFIRTGARQRGLDLLLKIERPLADRPEYWKERGWAELSKDPVSASRSFDRALSAAPLDIDALNGAASAAEALHDDEKALAFLLRARKVQPDDLRNLLHLGSICLRRDLTIDAREAIGRAYQLAPSNNLALFLNARVQIAFQRWQESHDLFSEFDRRVPDYAPAQYALGWLDTKLNRTAEARGHLERCLALAPRYTDAMYELGQLDLDEGRLDAAQQRLRAVLHKQPRHVKANIAMGDVLLRKADLAGARRCYEAAIETDPQSGPAHYKLSTVLMRLHEPELANKERILGARLNADAEKASKTVLVLADPDGRLLSGVRTNGGPQ